MAEAQSFELLKKKRKSFRTAVTKIVNELEAQLSNSDLNVDRLSELVETLSIKFEPLTLVDQLLEPLFKPEEFDGEFEITEEYREKVLLWQFRAKKKINEFLKPRVTSPSLQTTSSQSQDEHFRNSDNIRIKVPKYHITRFYGDDASKWLTFWNSFETAVHNNESLNKVDKFNYLKAHLGGSALNTVEGFPISAKAYDEAVELLKNRFANPEILIQAHMNKILSLQPLKNSNDLRSFRKFVDNCNVQLRSLNSLGVSSANYGKILCPMLLKLIPSDLLLDYNKLQQNGSGSDIQQLLSFLTQSLTAREQTYSTNKSSFELYDCRQETKSNFSGEHRSHKQQNQKSFHTACQLLTAPVKENKDKIKLSCIFCESMTHNSNEYANEGSHLPINIDPELSKHQAASTPLTQPCSSVSNGGARLEPRAETSSHQQAETSSMQPCSSVSNSGGGLKLRAETSGHQQAETSSMQPCSRVSDGEAGVEPRVETLELPDHLTSDVELQQPTPRRSRYGRLLKLRKGLVDSC
ncbi:uncharacterized protein TNCT_596341 [Trichonephila clavata]|uniref:Uncharacterized protein n=1 Tax=Trichonephila clavata TaxID=2740835 RepID=A0A8X6HC53_TRICU|nr:uncharacterized protein TNCT_596341 [Trichonephila clavata]